MNIEHGKRGTDVLSNISSTPQVVISRCNLTLRLTLTLPTFIYSTLVLSTTHQLQSLSRRAACTVLSHSYNSF